jgi:two-component system NtrC family sensor kinase
MQKDVSAVIEAMGDGLLLHTLDGKVTFINTAFEKMTGYEKSELVGKYVADVGAKLNKLEGAQIIAAAIENAMKGATPATAPIILISKAGKKTPVMLDVSFIRDTEGKPTIAVVMFKDITQLKKIEEKLEHLNRVLRAIRHVNQLITKERDREKLLKGICNNLTETCGYYNVWIALLDKSGKLIAHAESGLGSSFLPMVERLKRGELTACGQQALKQSEAVVTEDPASICTDCPLSRNYVGRGAATVRLEYGGKVYGFLSVSSPIELAVDVEEVGLFREVATDIAFALYNIELEGERKRAGEVLRESERWLSQIVEGSLVATFVIDSKHITTHWNKACENITGISANEVLGTKKQWSAFYSKERPVMADIVVDSCGEEEIAKWYGGKYQKTNLIEGAYEAEDFFPHLGEKGKWLFFTAEPVRDVQGKVVGAIEILQDITERKRADEKLKDYSQNLEKMVEEHTRQLRDAQEELLRSERLATLGQVSGSISHEIRNPLGVIDSSVYYLKTKLKDADKKILEHLERIKSSVDSSIAIIDSLLNLTRMKELRLENLDLVAITTDAINTSKVPARVSVTQNFPEQEVLVNADREQLRMAFKNIVKNAVEAMDGKGTLTVTVGSTVDSQVEVSFVDTGHGIATEDMEKIFQPLFSTKAKGIGFGLSIAKMVVDKHGGTIEAKAEPGKGANIVIRLPTEDVKIKNKI